MNRVKKEKKKKKKQSIKRVDSKSNKNQRNRRKRTLDDTQTIKKDTTKVAEQYSLRINNVVCTAFAGKELVLRLVQLAAQSRLDESVFPSSVSRMDKPETTISMFDTGRILCTGSPSISCALYAILLYIEKLNKLLDLNLQVWNFIVQNIVSSFSLGYKLNIDMFYTDNKTSAEGTAQYEPSLFRGCSYTHASSGLVFVLFASGRAVCTGAKQWDDAYAAYIDVLPLLAKYKLGEEYKLFDSQYKRTRAVDICESEDDMKVENGDI